MPLGWQVCGPSGGENSGPENFNLNIFPFFLLCVSRKNEMQPSKQNPGHVFPESNHLLCQSSCTGTSSRQTQGQFKIMMGLRRCRGVSAVHVALTGNKRLIIFGISLHYWESRWLWLFVCSSAKSNFCLICFMRSELRSRAKNFSFFSMNSHLGSICC